MDNHPSCRRLHKIPAHTFKDPGKWPQRHSRVLRSFLRSEPPIMPDFSSPSTPFVRSSRSSVVASLVSLKPLLATPATGEGKYVPIRGLCEGGVATFFIGCCIRSCKGAATGPANSGRASAPLCRSRSRGRLRRPLPPVRQRPGARGRRCACRPAAAPRSRAAVRVGRLPPLHRPPSPHAP